MKFVAGLVCHLCGKQYPATASWVCECLGPLEVTYDYAAIKPLVSRALIESRPKNLWRYREFLPIANDQLTFHVNDHHIVLFLDCEAHDVFS